MSKFKKLISLVLALAMCLSLFSTISFADDGETEESDPVENTAASGDYKTVEITIKNVVAGHTYYVYELLTGDFSEDEDGNVVLSNAEPGYSVARDENNDPYFTADEINAMLLSYTTETTTDEEGNETTKEVVETNEDGNEIYLTEGELSTKAYELVTGKIENKAGTYRDVVLETAVREIKISYSDADGEGDESPLVNGETSDDNDYYEIDTDSEGNISITFTLAEGYYVIYEAETEESSNESDASESGDTGSEDAEDTESLDDTTTSTTINSEDYQNEVDLVEEQEGTTISRCIVAIVWSGMDSATITLKTTTPTIDKNIVNKDDANKAISKTETTDEETKETTTVTEDSDGKVDTAAIGDTIEYELTGYLPDTTGYAYYYYILTDTMSQGLTLDLDSFVVDVEYANAVTSEKYEVTESNTALLDGAVFIVDIDDLDQDNDTEEWINPVTKKDISSYYEAVKDNGGNVTGYTYSYTDSLTNETIEYEYFVYVTYEYEYETTTVENEDGTTTTTESMKLDDDGNRVVSSTTFTLTLLNLVDQDFAKSTETDIITVSYNATLNSNAEVGLDANTNNVTLTYSNNPNSSEEYIPGEDDTTPPGMPGEDTPTGTTPKIWTYTYTTQVSVLKLDGDEGEEDEDGNISYTEALTGAEFTLTGTNLNSVVVTTGTTYEAATDENSDDDSTYYYLLQDGTYSVDDPSSETEDEDGTKSYAYDYADYEYIESVPEGRKYVKIEVDGVTYYFVKYVAVTVLKATETEDEDGETEWSVVGWVGDNGYVTFTGLNVGDYVLSETVTPDGYNTVNDIAFTIGVETNIDDNTGKYVFNWTVTYDSETLGEDAISYDENTGTFSMSVVNFPGFTLPSTGAIGQIVLYAIGLLLIFGAGTVLIVRKRRTRKNMLN